MPSGPSIVDEMANSALWLGLMAELGATVEAVPPRMEFDQAQHNFIRASRDGLGAHFGWLDGQEVTAPALLLDKLLPAAEAVLRRARVDEADARRYLGIIDAR